MPSVPTEKQFHRLRVLGGGSAGLSWTRRETEPFLRRGWVTADLVDGYYHWVRITADGLRALADGVDRYGMPEMRVGKRQVQKCSRCDSTERACGACGCTSYYFDVETLERAAAKG